MDSSTATALEPMLRKLNYRASPLGANDSSALLALPHIVKSFLPRQRMVREGDRPTHCCVVLSGFSFRHKVVAKGARQIVSLQMIGDMVNLPDCATGIADQSLESLTMTEAAFIPHEEIKRIAYARPAIGYAMWMDTLADASISREWTANVGRRDSHARVAHLLCEWAIRLKVAGLGEETRYELPMTQEQLADALGLTPPHVSRTLKELAEEGLISRTKRSIYIGDWKKLAKAGDFEPSYLHLRNDEPAIA